MECDEVAAERLFCHPVVRIGTDQITHPKDESPSLAEKTSMGRLTQAEQTRSLIIVAVHDDRPAGERIVRIVAPPGSRCRSRLVDIAIPDSGRESHHRRFEDVLPEVDDLFPTPPDRRSTQD